jgi:hypothetical protein
MFLFLSPHMADLPVDNHSSEPHWFEMLEKKIAERRKMMAMEADKNLE